MMHVNIIYQLFNNDLITFDYSINTWEYLCASKLTLQTNECLT